MDNNKEDIIYGLVSWESYLGEDLPPYSELALVKQFSADFSEQYHNFVGEEKEQALALAKELACEKSKHYAIVRLTKFKIYQNMNVWATFSAEVYAPGMQGALRRCLHTNLFDAGMEATLEEVTSCLNHHKPEHQK